MKFWLTGPGIVKALKGNYLPSIDYYGKQKKGQNALLGWKRLRLRWNFDYTQSVNPSPGLLEPMAEQKKS